VGRDYLLSILEGTHGRSLSPTYFSHLEGRAWVRDYYLKGRKGEREDDLQVIPHLRIPGIEVIHLRFALSWVAK